MPSALRLTDRLQDLGDVNLAGVSDRQALTYDQATGKWLPLAVVLGSRMPINVKDAPYSAVGDGTTDDTAAIQAAVTAAGNAHAQLFFPLGTYRITSAITITAAHFGLTLTGASKHGTTIRQDTNNTAIFILDDPTPSLTGNYMIFEKLRLTWNTQQTAAQTNSIAVRWQGAGVGAFAYHTYRELRIDFANTCFAIRGNAGSQITAWNCNFQNIHMSYVTKSLFDLPPVVANGIPVNTFENITYFAPTGGYVNDGTKPAMNMFGEFLIDGIDIEDWLGQLLVSGDGAWGTVRGFHIERHQVNTNNQQIIYLGSGTYQFTDVQYSATFGGGVTAAYLFSCTGSNCRADIGRITANDPSTGSLALFVASAGAQVKAHGLPAETSAVKRWFSSDSTTQQSIVSIDGNPPDIEPAALPAAAVGYRGREYLLRGAAGVSDRLVVCRKAIDDTYAWVDQVDERTWCRLQRAAAQTIANNTATAISWDTENANAWGMHSTVTNPTRVTATVAGLYLVTAGILWTANATGYREVRIKRSDGTFIRSVRGPSAGGADATTQSISVQLAMAVNDYFEVEVIQTSGGNLDVTAFQGYTGLECTRLTP